ncbi:hypothetical protein FPQ18DRAFT_300252 [Pyronema domesticum]|nr:hypothetical protein FPQ18DRAFT_300252 [Pyronema domesticum]
MCPEINGADNRCNETRIYTPPFDRPTARFTALPTAASGYTVATVTADYDGYKDTASDVHTVSPSTTITPNDEGEKIPGNPIIPPNTKLSDYLTKELSVDRINKIHLDLWWAGRPGNIHTLHAQKMMKRDITISENIELHLVWFDSTIFIKPLPAWILDYDFYQKHICSNEKLYLLANGWLVSYTKLVRYPSDFDIAMELKLLPSGMTWDSWCVLSYKLQKELNDDCTKVNKRYYYGELRLPRLNHIYRFLRGFSVYQNVYRQYDHFFSKNFAWLLLLVVYLSTILSALQVVIGIQDTSEKLMGFSYWVGLLSVALILFFVAVQLLLFIVIFVYHFAATVKNLEKEKMGWKLEPERVKSAILGRQFTSVKRTGPLPKGSRD